MENLTDIGEMLSEKLEIPYALSSVPDVFSAWADDHASSVFNVVATLADDHALNIVQNNDDDDDDDDDLPRFYEVDEPLEIEPDEHDFLTGAGSVRPSGSTDFGNLSDPNLSDYWGIEFDETGTITIQVLREEADFDPALWLVSGTVTDPNSQFGREIDFGDSNVIDFADDELPPATGIGPYGDPSLELTGQEGDIFTLIVTNYLSGPNTGGDGMFDYTLTIS